MYARLKRDTYFAYAPTGKRVQPGPPVLVPKGAIVEVDFSNNVVTYGDLIARHGPGGFNVHFEILK